jgi:hypothetical protein
MALDEDVAKVHPLVDGPDPGSTTAAASTTGSGPLRRGARNVTIGIPMPLLDETDETLDTTWWTRFLDALRDTGAVRYAAQAAGVSRATAYRHRQAHHEFADAWKDALEDACDQLELEARKRALSGSDRLLQFLLIAHRPQVFSERFREASPPPPSTTSDLPLVPGTEEYEREMAAFGMPAAFAVAAGPEAVRPPSA